MSKIKRVRLVFLSVFFWNTFVFANTSELYLNLQYINNKQVLLYKIMNWWNINDNVDELNPCHKKIKYERIGNIEVKYNKISKELTFLFKNSFANLVDIIKECKNCYGPTYLKNTFLNKDYFRHSKVKNIKKELSQLNKIVFKNVKQAEARKIIVMEKNILLLLEGNIGGLLLKNNNIALHQAGDFFRSCSAKKKEDFPITFTISNHKTGVILLESIVIWNKE
ncbi:MAG: hypothetical protein COA66_00760 [Arcobacter sp.]|nr:MAG: hypothetical protein COA66_00760 [Arcobacter sp.]